MSEILELQVSYQAGVITGNFEDVKASIEAKISDYTNVVYTSDTVKDAKKDIADLRKMRKVIDDKRKEIKRTWDDPYKAFEKMAKELIAIIDEPIEQINSQLEEFENLRKKEKREQIKAEYEKRFDSELAEYCQLESIWDEKWLNSTTTMKSIKDTMDAKKSAVEESIATIKDCGEETEDKALKMFKAGKSLQEVLAWINQYRVQKEEIFKKQREEEQERQRKAEEERIRKEEQERQAKAEAERKEAEAKESNENMARELVQEQSKQETSFGGFSQQQQEHKEPVQTGFSQEQSGFGGFEQSADPNASNNFVGFEQQVQDTPPVHGVEGFSQESPSTGFDTPPVQGFGVKQEEHRQVVFTVRVANEMANHFEGLITQWGYTDFDRR
ncbi:DUF1351 domain-containing protein [[Clostridium] polysaccharolyticum]|uniref:DUF1351 domain-containing protein n=1 Tax=[Clostridium] polysaccharolyticum TaxID=29364 RepID=A0A1H9YJU7_9FIRM|nr:DUF1351 domain-containing protein [[Clostridium] polysaccharolyticum]SES69317.1 Protein of unknown function [[Clostridium] polysaccharolyticum]